MTQPIQTDEFLALMRRDLNRWFQPEILTDTHLNEIIQAFLGGAFLDLLGPTLSKITELEEAILAFIKESHIETLGAFENVQATVLADIGNTFAGASAALENVTGTAIQGIVDTVESGGVGLGEVTDAAIQAINESLVGAQATAQQVASEVTLVTSSLLDEASTTMSEIARTIQGFISNSFNQSNDLAQATRALVTTSIIETSDLARAAALDLASQIQRLLGNLTVDADSIARTISQESDQTQAILSRLVDSLEGASQGTEGGLGGSLLSGIFTFLDSRVKPLGG